MLLVQKFLKKNSFEDLERDHGVKARVCGHKFSLNYDQIEARDDDPLAQECRGLILRVANPDSQKLVQDKKVGKTVVLARPFDRFFNLGQAAAADVDLDHPATAFYEKMDGTLCIVYFDDVKDEWHVATRSVPEADIPMSGYEEYTFRTLFEKAVEETVGKEFDVWTSTKLFRDTTYMFELTTPLNRIVVEYEGYGITLLAARKTATGKELHPAFVQARTKTPVAPRFRFGSLQEMVDFVSDRDPTKYEGIVVCDQNFNRVKIKNAGYLALNKVRDSVLKSPRGLIELLLLEKLDDAIPLFPDFVVERAGKLQEAFREMLASFEKSYKSAWKEAEKQVKLTSNADDAVKREHRKAFALAVKARGLWMAPAMEMYQGRADSLRDWIMKKRNIGGGWSNGFLDSVLRQLES